MPENIFNPEIQMEHKDWKHEANVFGKYLTGKLPTNIEVDLYCSAMEKNLTPISPKENKLLVWMMKHPSFTGWIDGANALQHPEGIIRKKIFIMTAILETSGNQNNLFLPVGFSPFYMFRLFVSGIFAVLKTIGGLIIIRWI